MWKAEGSILKVLFHFFGIYCENGDELARFTEQFCHLRYGNEAAVHEQFQPIPGSFNLLEAIADFGNKLRLGTAPLCLALIRSDGRAGTKHLLAEEHLICGRAEGILAKR